MLKQPTQRPGILPFSTTVAYAVRAVVELAGTPSGKPVNAARLAETADVPRHYLGKVLRQLSYMGILNSSRGRCGGFRIAVPAEQISLLEIVSCFDGSTRPTCLLCWEKCDAGADCPVHDNCTAAAESAERFLNETTVADLIRRGRRDANGIGCEH